MNCIAPEDVMTFQVSARTLYRDCLIELQQSDQGWRVLNVAHCLGEAESFFPALVYYCDRVAAKEDGRSLIDARVNRRAL